MTRISNALFGRELTHRVPWVGTFLHGWIRLSEFLSLARRRQARFERQNPDAPWLVPQAIEAIEQFLQPEHIGFEWGSGRSTLWFARRVAHVTSVEGRCSWFERMGEQITQAGVQDKVTLHLAEVTSEYQFLPEEVARYASAIDSISDHTLDFVLIDGHFREACLIHVRHKLKSGGLLIVDNSEVLPLSVFSSFQVSWCKTWNNGITQTTVMRLN